jgi:hypothetical protein
VVCRLHNHQPPAWARSILSELIAKLGCYDYTVPVLGQTIGIASEFREPRSSLYRPYWVFPGKRAKEDRAACLSLLQRIPGGNQSEAGGRRKITAKDHSSTT